MSLNNHQVVITFACPVGRGSSILDGWKVSEFQKYCSVNFHLRHQAEGLQFVFHFLAKCKSKRNGLFSKAEESLKYLSGSVSWLNLHIQIYLGANSTDISEVVPVYFRAEFAPAENRSHCQGHFIAFRNHLNVEVILADVFHIFLYHLQTFRLAKLKLQTSIYRKSPNKWLEFSPPRSAVRESSGKTVATQQLWSLTFPFRWIKRKLGHTGHSCGLNLEIWVCPQLYWEQYISIYSFCFFA